MKFILKSLIPGLFLLILALYAALQKTLLIALVGFLSFFVIGVTVIIEGWKTRNDNESSISQS